MVDLSATDTEAPEMIYLFTLAQPSMRCRRFGKQLAVIIEPALPFVGHAATSAAAFTVGMGISQVPHASPRA